MRVPGVAFSLDRMDPVRAIDDLGGAARPEDLKNLGVTRGRLLRAVRDGRVARPRYGVYALPDATVDAILRAAYRAHLSCLSACRALELPVIEDDRRSHLSIPRDRARRANDRRPIKGVVLHRHDEGSLGNDVSRALDLLGLCAGRLQQIVAVDAALHRELMTEQMLETWVHTDPARRDWIAARCDGGAQSHLETLTRVALADEGFHVESQVKIPGLGHVDLMVNRALIVETDGAEFHDNPQAWREDLRRNNVATRGGYPFLRFTYSDVMGDRALIVAAVKETLGLPR